MKAEYLESKNTSGSLNMFSKLHHHHQQQQQQQQHHHQQQQQPPQQHQQQPQPQQQQQLPFTHHFHLSRDSQTSEEDNTSHNSAATATTTPSTSNQKLKPNEQPGTGGGSGDGASIEVVRRPRGRPPGSKNKPKPPVFITREPEPAMNPYILEVPGGNDVVEAISNFCRRKSIGICVLTGSGTVANVTLRQPSATPGATITFHGRFDILSISATFLPQNSSFQPIPNIFAISLAGPQGQIVGGSVVGPLIAAGTVYVIAASFNNPSYHRLPIQEEPRNTLSGGGGGNEAHSPVASSGGGGGADSGHMGGGESCGMSIYNCHLPGGGGNDVIWAPTARPPSQQPPPY